MVETEWKNATIPIGWGYDEVACEQTRNACERLCCLHESDSCKDHFTGAAK